MPIKPKRREASAWDGNPRADDGKPNICARCGRERMKTMFNDTRMTRQAARVIARKTVNFLRGYLDPWERKDIPGVGDLAGTLYTRRGAVVAYLQEMWEDAHARRDQDGMKGLQELMDDISHPMWAVWALE